jgi:hypothetical protein
MRFIIVICMSALLVSACSKVPNQATYPYSYQQKMQSIDHWERLAYKVVGDQVRPFFKDNSYNSNIAVYVKDDDRSAFGTAFHTYLTTELFNRGMLVSEIPADSLTIEWSVQKVFHNAERKNPGPPFGIIGLVGAALGSVVGGDYHFWSHVPHTELLVTIKLKDGNMVYSRTTESLYVNDEDTAHYWVLPDNTKGVASTFVRQGSTVCREPSDLDVAFTYNSEGTLELNHLVKEGRCAIMEKDYPVSIIEDKSQYSVIKSEESPYYIYVTPHSSLGG